jgi:hypothetical protein
MKKGDREHENRKLEKIRSSYFSDPAIAKSSFFR